jgi:hypothetical protein
VNCRCNSGGFRHERQWPLRNHLLHSMVVFDDNEAAMVVVCWVKGWPQLGLAILTRHEHDTKLAGLGLS